jgi:hypothetical protein
MTNIHHSYINPSAWNSHGMELPITQSKAHFQTKKHIFKPKKLSIAFGNRKNHGMTPQFTHKK